MPEQRARDYHRGRVASTFTEEITAMLEGELSDPRIASCHVTEVILALGATVEGATTAHWLTDRLRPYGVAVTKVAQGVPMGGALDALDDGTLAAALRARRAS